MKATSCALFEQLRNAAAMLPSGVCAASTSEKSSTSVKNLTTSSMFVDLQNNYDWVLQPVVGYPSVDRPMEVLEDRIARPAEAKFTE